MNIVDFNGNDISEGDIVLFTAPGAGRNLPPLQMGEVVNLTKAGVTLYRLNKDRSRVQREDYYMEGTGEFRIDWSGNSRERERRVVTGLIDAEPVNIRYYKDRFIIL